MLSVTPSGQRADDWICTSIIRFTRPAPFSVEPRRQTLVPTLGSTPREPLRARASKPQRGTLKQECKESNPAGRFWRPLASQKHTPVSIEGDRRELNPFLLLHRQACLPRTPRTPYCLERKEKESNPQGRKAQPASNRVPSPIGLPFRFVFSISSPTRNRTRNFSLEARHDVRFTIEPKAEGGGIEPYPTPLPERLVSNQVPEPVRLPSVFQWTHRELNSDSRHARAVSSRWTMSPLFQWT